MPCLKATTRAITLLILVGLVAVSSLGCGESVESGEDYEPERKARALDGARKWTVEKSQQVTADLLVAIISDIPDAGPLGLAVVAQLEGVPISWDYAEPVDEGEYSYKVIATASLQVTLDLPPLPVKTYEVSLPFGIWVDVVTSSATYWGADFRTARVVEVEQ